MRITLPIASLTLVCFAATAAWGDDASKRAKVEEFIKLSKTEQSIAQGQSMVLNQVKAGIAQQMGGAKQTPEQAKLMNELQDKIAKLLYSALSWDQIKVDYVKLYNDAYTEEELDGMIGFYKSPAGQAMLAKTPELIARGNEIGQKRMAVIAPQIQKLMSDYMDKAMPGPAAPPQRKP